MIIDTHTHLDDEAFDTDRDELIKSFEDAGISRVVNIGADLKTSRSSVALSEKYDNIFAVVGVHPSETNELDEKALIELESMASHDKVVAIGEIGLDYYWDNVDREKQKFWFIKQLKLAKKLKLPVVIHSRDAALDTFEILKQEINGLYGGVIHCYSYSPEMAKEFEKLGFFFGIGGVVTFKNSRKLKETVSYLPLEKIVLETDAPYLAPVPNRGKRNSPLNLSYVLDEIAAIKGLDKAYIIEQTQKNAHALYPKLK